MQCVRAASYRLCGLSFSLLLVCGAQAALSVSAVGEYTRPTTPEGLSGVTYAGADQYYTVDDSGALMWPAVIGVNRNTGAVTSCVFGASAALSGVDFEGIAYNPANNSIFASDETGATIKEYALGGAQLSIVSVPANLLAYRNNFSLESLTIRGDGLELWTANEEALYNSALGIDDGALSTTTVGSVVRLTRFSRPHVHAAWTASGQWAYQADPMKGGPYGGNERSGVADLCVLPNGALLVLEREFSGDFIPTFRARLYEVSFSGATDVSGIQSLNGSTYTKVSKTRLWNQDTGFANYEGLCLGPRLTDGALSLLLISDGDGSAYKKLYALTLQGLNTRDLTVTSAQGTAYPAGGPYRLAYGTAVDATVTPPPPGYEQRQVCAGWTLTGHTPGAGAGTACAFNLVADATLNWQWTEESAATMPVSDTFEEYAPGTSMDNVFGWTGSGMVTGETYQAALPPGYAAPQAQHTRVMGFDGPAQRVVDSAEGAAANMDVMLRAVRSDTLPVDLEPALQTAFAVASNGVLHARHLHHDPAQGWIARWTALCPDPVPDGAWVRVSVSFDYSSNASGDTLFCPRLNGSLCPTPFGFKAPDDMRSPGPWYVCANSPGCGGSGSRRLSAVLVTGTGSLDDLVITTASFAHTGAAETNGVPFAWFDQQGLARRPDTDSDGDGHLEEMEYLAGTDPTDRESIFRVVASWVQDGRVYVKFTGNDSGAATPYVMERTTDLTSGVWEVVDDAIPRVAAPQAFTIWSEPLQPAGPYLYRPKAVPGGQ